MSRQRIPDDVLDLAHARREARADGAWARADELKEAIQEAGWKVVDRGVDFELQPLRPPDVVRADRILYGSSDTVPSGLLEPPNAPASVILVATDQPGDLDQILAALAVHAPSGTQVIVVASAPDDDQTAELDDLPTIADTKPELIWTSTRLNPAAALNAGLRRAAGAVVIALDPRVEPIGDAITPLVRALDDPTVAIAGAWGLVSADGRRFEPTAGGEADAIDGACQAFRRTDAVARGPLDERFRTARHLDVWWSLVLREDEAGGRPRRAVALDDLPVVLHGRPEDDPSDARSRLEKRDFYRLLDRFGHRADLFASRDREPSPA